MSSEPATSRTRALGNALLRLERVGITHDGASLPTPQDVSFEVHPGEVVLVLGPSGSGKSTLALALNGLVPHAVPARLDGRVVVAGIDTREASVAQLATTVGMVFQDPDAQIVTGTVLDEVAFGPENLRMPKAEVLARSEAALRRLGLWERRDDNPDRLSGGGRQRLAIAAALAMGSRVLVLDEPTANLDPQGIDEVYAALAEVIAGGEHAIVLVEHNLDQAIGFVDRVIVLDAEGRLIADGPAHETLRERAEALHALGVWLPTATLAALRLRRAGYALDPLPLTPSELRAALDAQRAPAHPLPSPPQLPLPPPPSEHSLPRARTRSGAHSANEYSLGRREGDGAAAIIEVDHLTIRRGGRALLDDVSLTIDAGEFVAVVGANGAGKTTLVQAIAGVVPATKRTGVSGGIRVGSLDPGRADVRALIAQIGFVFQDPEHQFIAQTVFDELAHGMRVRGATDAEIEARVSDVLTRFGLAGREQTHPFLLSGGQKRRLSVGTALVAGAPVLALDEPTFGQDRARADELLQLLHELHEQGTTIIVVTHDMQLVAEHASRTIVVDGGRIAADGPTGEVFADEALLQRAGLRPPPLALALSQLAGHPRLSGRVRLGELPDGAQ